MESRSSMGVLLERILQFNDESPPAFRPAARVLCQIFVERDGTAEAPILFIGIWLVDFVLRFDYPWFDVADSRSTVTRLMSRAESTSYRPSSPKTKIRPPLGGTAT